MEPINTIFTEKYRPKKVNDIVGDFKDKIKNYLKDPQAIPHFLLISKSPGTGKCLTGDEMFFTKDGLTSFKDYSKKNNISNEFTKKHERIYDIENNFVNTSYFYKSEDDVIRIKTKRGYEVKGTKNHKIKVFDINEGIIWKKLSDIKPDDLIPIFFNTQIFGNNNKLDYNKLKPKKQSDHSSININKPIEINNDIAYFLGVLRLMVYLVTMQLI